MKRILSILLTLLLIVGAVPYGAEAVTAEPAKAETALAPQYVCAEPQTFEALDTVPEGYTPINDAIDLYLVRDDMAGNYILMNDIDLAPYLAEGGDLYNAEGWIALGYSAASSSCVEFTGTFDGNGHRISGLNCSGMGAGLFWHIGEGGTLKNLTIASGEIAVSNKTPMTFGCFAQANRGTIENCHNYANIHITQESYDYIFVGGIVGSNENTGLIHNCSNRGTVAAVGSSSYSYLCYAGGIAGSYRGTLNVVWNHGAVSASSKSGYERGTCAGGVAGGCYYYGKLSNAYNTAIVIASNTLTTTSTDVFACAGGVAGYDRNTNGSSDSLTCCYNIGEVTAAAAGSGTANAGGICGYSEKAASISKCYFLNNIETGVGNNATNSCVSLSDALMKRQQSFGGFDFDSVWSMGTGDYLYPVLTHVHQLTHIAAVEATCTKDGNIEYWICEKCSRCFADAEANREIQPSDTVLPAEHDYHDQVVAPTCTAEGYTKHVCSRCGASYTDSYIAPLGHNLVTGAGQEPTCTQPGHTAGTYCTRCDYVQSGSETIPALGHNWGGWTVTTAATCTVAGVETRTCSRCGEKETRPVAASGHTPGSPARENEASATCTAAGSYDLVTRCAVCRTVLTTEHRYISALGHSYTETVTPPACTAQGYTTHRCARCGDTYTDTFTAALGHNWNDGVLVKEPKEGESGLRRYTCTRCNATRDEVVPSLDHTHHYTAVITAPTCTAQGYTTYTCSCGDSYVAEYVPAQGHAFSDWNTTTAPTCTTAGVQSRLCARCGALESREAEALGHDYQDGVCIRCGQEDPNQTSTGPDKTALEQAIAKAKAVDPDLYTTESVAALNAVLSIAQTVAGTENAAQELIDAAEKLLTDAIAALEKKPGDNKPGLPCSGGEDCPGKDFKDMPAKGNWAHDPIDWAVVRGVTAGTSNTTFSPNDTCTRAQVVTFLWRANGQPEPTRTSNPFTDVPADAYYYKAVLWAVEHGVTAGTSETTFSPNQGCTRGQVVTFLWRAEGQPEPGGTNPFTDVPDSAYYYKAVLWAVEQRVTAGTSDTTFSPNDTCTRAQIVTFLYRACAE